ncbi:MAG: DUF2516 family protein [Nocardioidaceae bacterium]|nr:DUF2516 family protein [Nocardioidaceae bacterium]
MELSLFAAMGTVEAVISLVLFACKAFAFVDAVTRPAAAFNAADKQTKQFWLIVLGLFLFAHLLLWRPIGILNLIGTVAALVYLADVRPALRALGPGRH